MRRKTTPRPLHGKPERGHPMHGGRPWMAAKTQGSI